MGVGQNRLPKWTKVESRAEAATSPLPVSMPSMWLSVLVVLSSALL